MRHSKVVLVIIILVIYLNENRMKAIFHISTIFILLTLSSSFAFSCTCPNQSQRQRFRQADTVIIGKVLDFRKRTEAETKEVLYYLPFQATFKVEKQWKGKRQSEITALVDGDSPGMCGDLDLQIGNQFLIYAPKTNGELVIERDCGPNAPVSDNTQDEIKRLSNFFFCAYTFLYPFPKF